MTVIDKTVFAKTVLQTGICHATHTAIAVQIPLFVSHSDTLQADIPKIQSTSAVNTILSPAFDNGFFISILPFEPITVFIKKLIGWIIVLSVPRA